MKPLVITTNKLDLKFLHKIYTVEYISEFRETYKPAVSVMLSSTIRNAHPEKISPHPYLRVSPARISYHICLTSNCHSQAKLHLISHNICLTTASEVQQSYSQSQLQHLSNLRPTQSGKAATYEPQHSLNYG